MRNFFFFIAFFFINTSSLFSQSGYEITFKLEGYTGDTIRLANYLMNNQYLKDTAVLNKATKSYTFSGEEALKPGMYLVVMPPDNKFFQVLINEKEQFFTVETNPENPTENIKIKGSPDNKLFYDYLNFLAEQRPLSEEINKQLEAATSEKEKEKIEAKKEAINQKVSQKQLEIIENHPNSLTAVIIKANLPLDDMPEFAETDETELQIKKWQWTKEHYFDNIDLTDPRLLRMPFLFQRVDYYISKLTVQHPDSLSQSLFRILDTMQPAKDNFKYYLVHYLNEYAKSKIVGFDAIYVALVERYYKTGLADWTEEEQLKKILENAETLNNLLIGKLAPNIQMERQDGTGIALHEVKSPYTVLLFWAPDCGHCKKAMPAIIDFYSKYKDKGVEIMAVCTKFMKETEDCWKMVEEKEMGVFLNAVDPYHRSKYKTIYDVRTTPQIYILDENKFIISKKIGSEQLEEVMDQLILRDQEMLEKGNK